MDLKRLLRLFSQIKLLSWVTGIALCACLMVLMGLAPLQIVPGTRMFELFLAGAFFLSAMSLANQFGLQMVANTALEKTAATESGGQWKTTTELYLVLRNMWHTASHMPKESYDYYWDMKNRLKDMQTRLTEGKPVTQQELDKLGAEIKKFEKEAQPICP